MYWCKEHKRNPTHDTENCYVLLMRKEGKEPGKKKCRMCLASCSTRMPMRGQNLKNLPRTNSPCSTCKWWVWCPKSKRR